MKWNIRLSLTLITIACIAISCQKELSLEDGTIVPPIADDTILLVKMIEIDSISPIENDSIIVNNTYDARNRITDAYAFFSADPAVQALNYTHESYFYFDTDSLPDLVVNESSESGPLSDVMLDSTFLVYNTTGKLLWDSTIHTYDNSFNYNEKKWYSYSGDTVRISIYRDGAFVETETNIVTIVNGNVTRAEHQGIKYEFFYDNKPNAFNAMSNLSFRFSTFAGSDPIYYPQRNNCIRFRTLPGSAFQQSGDITHTYRSNGLPSGRTIKSITNDPIPINNDLRTEFYYAKRR
jgi:hypothetical protein